MTPEDFVVTEYTLLGSGREIKVQWRGPDSWAVSNRGSVYNVDGQWEYEPLSSHRDEAFIARTRYNLETAFAMARKAAAAEKELMQRRQLKGVDQ